MTRWNDDGTGSQKPDWPANNANIIATNAGWVERTIVRKTADQSVHKIRDELLVSIGGLATRHKIAKAHHISWANSSWGKILRVGNRAEIDIAWNEPVKLKSTNARLRVTIANTAGGNNLVALSNSATLAYGANNVMRFPFVPGVKGTYKIQAQTLVKANTATSFTANLYSLNTGNETANLVLNSTISNAAIFRVYGNATIFSITFANTTSGSTYKVGNKVWVKVRFDEQIKIGAMTAGTLAVANTAAGSAKTATANLTIGLQTGNTVLWYQFTPTVAGTYKVQAQTGAFTGKRPQAQNKGRMYASLYVSGAVSNTASTITVS